MKFSKKMNSITMLAVLLLISTSIQAQPRRRPRFRKATPRVAPVSYLGLKIGQDFRNEVTLAGAHLWMPVGRYWRLAPGFDYFLGDKNNHWQFNGDFIFQAQHRSPLYLGGGLAVDYQHPDQMDAQTRIGGNAFVGLVLGRHKNAAFQPFIQARWRIHQHAPGVEQTYRFGYIGIERIKRIGTTQYRVTASF